MRLPQRTMREPMTQLLARKGNRRGAVPRDREEELLVVGAGEEIPNLPPPVERLPEFRPRPRPRRRKRRARS